MEKENNQIKNRLTTIVGLLLITLIIIGVVLFVILKNNTNKDNNNASEENISKYEEKKNNIKIDLSLKNENNSCGDNAYYTYDELTHCVNIIGYGTIDLTGEQYTKHYGGPWADSYGMPLLYVGDDERPYDVSYGSLIFPLETEKIIINEGITGIRSKSALCDEGGVYENLKEIVLPESLKELEMGCFSNQKNLEKINIPNSIKVIPSNAFYNCNKLYYINFPNNLSIIESDAFSGCATLSEVKLHNIKYIGTQAFGFCYNLKNVEINGDIERLYSYTFESCLNLENVKLTNNIKYIANDTFNNCNSLDDEKLLKLFYNREKTHQYQEVLDRKKLEKLKEQVMED